MFTRCPKCKTSYPLTAAELSQARGLVLCGQCGRAFSALSFLFDSWPSGQAKAPVQGTNIEPPVLGKAGKTTAPLDDGVTGEEEVNEDTHKPNRLTWGLMTALLVLVTIANIGWTFRESLVKNPAVDGWLNQKGGLQVKHEGLLKAPDQFELISRDMHAHPTRSGILVLSLTFVNLARHPQAFPILKITLLDASNQPVAQRRFQPNDYLRPGADIKSGLATDVFLPVLLELGDPGKQAVGFEIEFL